MMRVFTGPECKRRGSVFHVYLIYIALTSMLLASCAICLKLLLQSSSSTQTIYSNLRTLESAQRQLRSDMRASISAKVSDTSLSVIVPDGEVRWNIDGGRLIRRMDAPTASLSDFRFSAADHLSWKQDGDLVSLKIIKALPMESDERPLANSIARSPIVLTFKASQP